MMTLSSTIDQSASPIPPATREMPVAATCRVTQVSTTDLIGGAARAAQRLHHALGDAGVRSRMLVAQRIGADPETVEYNPFAPLPPAVGRMFFRLGRRWHRPSMRRAGAYFSPEWTLMGWRLRSQLPPCDVVNLHWVTDLLDYRTLPALTAHCPVVWTFHDMNAFTGGCHYSGSCVRYADRCGACPQLANSSGENDMTRRVLKRKRRILQQVAPSRLVAVCPSAWLAREARCSALFRDFNVRVIPNGIDPQEFRPIDQAEARAQLNLPMDARIVLFVAEAIADRRKGLRQLLRAIDLVRDVPNLRLVTIGRGDFSLLRDPLLRHLGSLSDSASLRAAYSAADVFAIPSLQDNLPNTILEAMACGTPVAGFAAGGVGEAVLDGETGLLAPTGDSVALAIALRRLLEHRPLARALGQQARRRIEKEYTVRLQALRYAALYQEMLQAPRAAPR